MKIDLEDLLWTALRIVWLSTFILLGALACAVLVKLLLTVQVVLQ